MGDDFPKHVFELPKKISSEVGTTGRLLWQHARHQGANKFRSARRLYARQEGHLGPSGSMSSKGDGALLLCWIFGPLEIWVKMSLFINGFDE